MEGGVPCQGMLAEGVHRLEEGVVGEDHHLEGVEEEVDHHQEMVVGEVAGDHHQEMEVGEVVVGLHQGLGVGVGVVAVVVHCLVGVEEGVDQLKHKNKNTKLLKFLVPTYKVYF